MAYSVDQTIAQTITDNHVAALVVGFGSPVAAHALLTLGGLNFPGGGVATVIDDKAQSWTVVQPASNAGSQRSFIAYFLDSVAGVSAVTITFNQATGNYSMVAGKSATTGGNPSAVDQSATATDPGPQANDATVTTGSITAADEFIAAAMSTREGNSTDMQITDPASFTVDGVSQDYTNHCAGWFGHRILTGGSGAQTVAWTHLANGATEPNGGWTDVAVTFKAAAGGGGALFPPFPQFQPSTQLRM